MNFRSKEGLSNVPFPLMGFQECALAILDIETWRLAAFLVAISLKPFLACFVYLLDGMVDSQRSGEGFLVRSSDELQE